MSNQDDKFQKIKQYLDDTMSIPLHDACQKRDKDVTDLVSTSFPLRREEEKYIASWIFKLKHFIDGIITLIDGMITLMIAILILMNTISLYAITFINNEHHYHIIINSEHHIQVVFKDSDFNMLCLGFFVITLQFITFFCISCSLQLFSDICQNKNSKLSNKEKIKGYAIFFISLLFATLTTFLDVKLWSDNHSLVYVFLPYISVIFIVMAARFPLKKYKAAHKEITEDASNNRFES